jgi:hypothetical protein
MSTRIKDSELWNKETECGMTVTGDKTSVTITNRVKVDGDWRYDCVCDGVSYSDIPRRGVQALADSGTYRPRDSKQSQPEASSKQVMPETYEHYLEIRLARLREKFAPMKELCAGDPERLKTLLQWQAEEESVLVETAQTDWSNRVNTLASIALLKTELADLKAKVSKALRENDFDYITSEVITNLKNKVASIEVETSKL